MFIHCHYVWTVWWHFIKEFGLSFVFPPEMMDLLIQWSMTPFTKKGKTIWRYLPIVIIWSIWVERNKMIFLDKRKTTNQLLECISIRLANWALEEPCFKGVKVDDIIRNSYIIIESSPLPMQVVHWWQLLGENTLKLNFDGSSLGNPGPLGMGGTIYDASGTCIVAFSGPLGYGDPLNAKIKALLYGLRLIHSKGMVSHNIKVEGDSAIVIGWMAFRSNDLWKLSHIIKEAAFLASSLNISFKWIPREANEGADRLVKRGVAKASIYVGSLEEIMM